MLGVVAEQALGDAARLLGALHLERERVGRLQARVALLLDAGELDVQADIAPDGNDRREADAVEPVVDDGRAARR